MRSFIRRTIIVGTSLGIGLVWSGCKEKQATEYVAGISTQVIVPRDLKVVRVDVNVGGIPQFCQGYKVFNGVVQLPRSLGSYPNRDSSISGSGPITYTIVGFTEDIDLAGANPLLSACAQPKVGQDSARILRRSRQPYIPEEILFLPMPLKYACFDKNCEGENQTCKGGKCVSAEYSEEQARVAFPRFTPDLVDGTGGSCFSTSVCMAAASPVVPVDPVNCIYAVPNTPSAPAPIFGPNIFSGPSSGDGVNVEITYDGGLTKEVLDLDPDEGFSIPDPTKPQRFKLAPGLCEMVHGVDDKNGITSHRITNIRTSGTCQSKKFAQPFCAPDQLKAMGLDTNGQPPNPPPADVCSSVELKPPQAALVFVVDNTPGHAAFFSGLNKSLDTTNADTLAETAVGPAITAALSDPAFARTDIGLVYAGPSACTAGPPDIAVDLASTTRDPILNSLKAQVPGPAAALPALEGGLDRAYTELRLAKYSNYFRRAVLVIGNAGFDDANGCAATPGGPIERATTAHNEKIDTYVIQFTKDPPKQGSAENLAAAGGTAPSAYKVDEARVKFQDIVNSLGTCVYDVNDDASKPKETDTVSFSNPLAPTPETAKTDIPHNAACKGDNIPGNGWGYADAAPAPGKKRIFLCNDPCAKFRDVLKTTSLFTTAYGQPPIPIPIFAYRAACTTTNGP